MAEEPPVDERFETRTEQLPDSAVDIVAEGTGTARLYGPVAAPGEPRK
ncbi:hypothetical protein ACQYWQ_19740 [Streptomyces sp. P6-2-1]